MRTRSRVRPCTLVFGICSLLFVAACGGLDEGTLAGEGERALEDVPVDADGQGTLTALGRAETGNGAPSGSHFTLNIIGKANDISTDMTGNSGHRIFVALAGNTRINLSEGDFAVLDANGTDGTAAFRLPNPDPENDGVTTYSVFARALGTPGGSATMTTCATDPVTGDEYCSTENVVLVRSRGGSKLDNVSRELLYLYIDLDGDGAVERYPLFSDALEDYFWSYDNSGLRIAQLRFYPIATDTN